MQLKSGNDPHRIKRKKNSRHKKHNESDGCVCFIPSVLGTSLHLSQWVHQSRGHTEGKSHKAGVFFFLHSPPSARYLSFFPFTVFIARCGVQPCSSHLVNCSVCVLSPMYLYSCGMVVFLCLELIMVRKIRGCVLCFHPIYSGAPVYWLHTFPYICMKWV